MKNKPTPYNKPRYKPDHKTTRPNDLNVQKLVEELIDSTTNLSDVLPGNMIIEDLTPSDCKYIDSKIKRCIHCHVWKELEVMSDESDLVCIECVE